MKKSTNKFDSFISLTRSVCGASPVFSFERNPRLLLAK